MADLDLVAVDFGLSCVGAVSGVCASEFIDQLFMVMSIMDSQNMNIQIIASKRYEQARFGSVFKHKKFDLLKLFLLLAIWGCLWVFLDAVPLYGFAQLFIFLIGRLVLLCPLQSI
jgi:hypothetical protein